MGRITTLTRDWAKLYKRPPSFTDLLPWTGYVPQSKLFVLEDGFSLAVLFELFPVGSEAVELDFLEEVRELIQVALVDALPEHADHPWVLQLFVQDDFNLSNFQKEVSRYASQEIRQSNFSQQFESEFADHLNRLSRDQGLFVDEAGSQKPWRGRVRRIRATLYQRVGSPSPIGEDSEQHLLDVLTRLRSALAVTGVGSKQLGLAEFREWLVPWFNPDPDWLERAPKDVMRTYLNPPHPLPDSYDVGQDLMYSQPRSDGNTGTWWFDGLPHEVISIQGMRRTPAIGHLSAERDHGEQFTTLMDQLPLGAVTAMTITVLDIAQVRQKVERVKKATIGDTAEVNVTREMLKHVEDGLARGNKLFQVSLAFYLCGEDLQELKKRTNELLVLLVANGIQPIAQESDMLRLDSYLRNLPMAFDPALDKIQRRSKLMSALDVASLFPVYGRARGRGHPGLVFFNRGAEPLCFDPLNTVDRKKNGHLLVVGPTGSGKSATLTYLLQQVMARHRPRVFIIEAGGSFGLLGEYFQGHGLTVNQVTLRPDSEVSLPPFVAAMNIDNTNKSMEGRDHLGEMEIIAKIMITGGDANEQSRLTRADQLMIRSAILSASQVAKESKEPQVLTESVVSAFRRMASDQSLESGRRTRANEMADGMALFCSGLAGHLFNRPGIAWPDVDVTILEMGLLAREGYEDLLSVAYLSLMTHINDLVESRQQESRQTLVVTDEGHLILTHPLLSNYIVKITKMWRKFGAWFWLATQNLTDFPADSKRMLSMIEWWLCLAMPKDEVAQLERFRDITPAQRRLLLSAKKEPGKYVEGVVFSDEFEALFRNVPPAMSLALAQSEKHEKARRRELMEEHQCAEYEAAQMIAQEMMAD